MVKRPHIRKVDKILREKKLMDFEFNFGQTTVSQGIKKNAKVYASVPGVAVPLSNEELVFLNRETGNNSVMTHQVLHALSLCQEFKPMDQHVNTIMQSIPQLQNQVAAVEKVTEFLINNKLLIEESDWVESLSKTSQQVQITSAGLVVRSCDRPQQLLRLLGSLVKYQEKFNQNFNVQVYDDSTSEKNEKELEKLCLDYKDRLSIQFYGTAWQAQFTRMLKDEFQESHDLIDWLLAPKDDQFTGGRVWNFALLNNSGKKFLFFDDDYVFEPRTIETQNNKVDFSDRSDLNVGFSANLSEIKQTSKSLDEDLLGQMLASCGQTIGNWLSTSDIESGNLTHLNYQELQRMSSSSIIKSTCNGTWGSPRSNSNYWLYFLEGEQKEEFWETREGYLDNIEASNLLHYSQGYDLLSLSKFSPSAIDNSCITPFAVPTNRVEDHFFNSLMLFCYPDQVSLHFPAMMGHIQTQKRDRSGMNHIARRPNFNKFIADYALTLLNHTDAVNPELRMKTLAFYIKGLADSKDENIHNRLKEYLTQIRSDIVLEMQTQLAKSPEAPVYWQADVRELIEANGKAILKNSAPILDDWDDDLDRQACVDLAREEMTQVSEALDLWPQLWNFCKTK